MSPLSGLIHLCGKALIVMLVGGLVTFAVTWFFARRARQDRQREKEILGRALISIVAITGSWFSTAATLLCRAGDPCARGWDLNCSGASPVIYTTLAIASALVACAVLARELSQA